MPKHVTESVDASITADVTFTTGACKVSPGGSFQADVIAEYTAATGVTVDGVLLKDSDVTCDVLYTDVIDEDTAAAGVTIDGVELKDSEVTADKVNITVSAALGAGAGLVLTNTSDASGVPPSITFEQSNATFPDMASKLYADYANLTLKHTSDAWVTSLDSALFTSTYVRLVSSTNLGYLELRQTHTSTDGSIVGNTRVWTFQDENATDDCVIQLPVASQGIVIGNAYGNTVHANGIWSVLSDGTVTLIVGNETEGGTRTDGKFTLSGSGTTLHAENRLGGAAKVRLVYYYL